MGQTLTTVVAKTDRDALQDLTKRLAFSLHDKIAWKADLPEFEASFKRALDANDDGVVLGAKLRELESFADERKRRSMASVARADHRVVQEFDAIDDPVAAAIYLCLEHPKLYDFAQLSADADAQVFRRSWGGYRITQKPSSRPPCKLSDDDGVRFAEEVRNLFPEADAKARYKATWFTRHPRDIRTGKRRQLIQATIYVERRPESGVRFSEQDEVVRETRRPVADATILYDLQSQEIDVIVQGGKAVQDKVAAVFVRYAFREEPAFERIERRRLGLERLRHRDNLLLFPEDDVVAARLVCATLQSPTGDGFMITLKRPSRSQGAEVWSGARSHLRKDNPLERSDWPIIFAELKLTRKPDRVGGRPKSFPVRMTAPNRINLHDLLIADAEVARPLLERWGVFDARDVEEND